MQLRISSTTHLNNAGFFYASYNVLPNERKEAVDKCHNEADKFRSIVAGTLLVDAFLDTYPLLSRDDLGPVSTNEHGKPYLNNFSEWRYNISHSGKYAAIAYEDRPDNTLLPDALKEIGVDIQSKRKISDGVVRRILNESEQDSIGKENLAEELILNALWSIKESYIKFIGRGLSFDMRKVVIDDIDAVIPRITALINGTDTNKARSYVDMTLISQDREYPDAYCRFFTVPEDYSLSVCSGTDNLPCEYIIY